MERIYCNIKGTRQIFDIHWFCLRILSMVSCIVSKVWMISWALDCITSNPYQKTNWLYYFFCCLCLACSFECVAIIALLVQWVSNHELFGWLCSLFVLVPIYCSFPLHYRTIANVCATTFSIYWMDSIFEAVQCSKTDLLCLFQSHCSIRINHELTKQTASVWCPAWPLIEKPNMNGFENLNRKPTEFR